MTVCTVIWNEEDVRSVEADINKTSTKLTNREVKTILQSMQDTHDASLGITWDTIEYWIEVTIDKRGMN